MRNLLLVPRRRPKPADSQRPSPKGGERTPGSHVALLCSEGLARRRLRPWARAPERCLEAAGGIFQSRCCGRDPQSVHAKGRDGGAERALGSSSLIDRTLSVIVMRLIPIGLILIGKSDGLA